MKNIEIIRIYPAWIEFTEAIARDEFYELIK